MSIDSGTSLSLSLIMSYEYYTNVHVNRSKSPLITMNTAMYNRCYIHKYSVYMIQFSTCTRMSVTSTIQGLHNVIV
jgi:hypothetical protein